MRLLFSKAFVLVVFCMSLMGACKKDSSSMDPVPKLTLISTTPSTVLEFTDSVVFKIQYEDGDGDLGENNADVKNLFIIDNRIGIMYEFRIQQLAPDNATIPIKGNLNAVLQSLSITDGTNLQNATFSIYVKDRAGNQSNTVTSGNVIIVK